MSRADVHRFRRALWNVEEALLSFRSPSTAAEVEEALRPLAPLGGAGAEERVTELCAVAAGREPAGTYVERHGACGVRRFSTAGGRAIFRLPIETFPDHVNNVYLVVDGGGALLVDAGSHLPIARDDLTRAARVLAALHELPEILDHIVDLLVTHGHIDHYGGAGGWKKRGARVHVHELDARVLTRFDERVVVAALGLRAFLASAGVPAEERAELGRMYLMGKSLFKPVPVDGVLVDGSVVAGAIAHHVPGHCPGQVVVQVDDVLLTADQVLPRITPHQSPESITPWTGLDHYFQSLEKVRRLPGIALALPGHEEPIADLGGRITEIEMFHRGRLAKVRELCAEEPRTIADVTRLLFGEQIGYGRILAYEEAGAHVEYLSRRGHLEIANLDELQRDEHPVVSYRAA